MFDLVGNGEERMSLGSSMTHIFGKRFVHLKCNYFLCFLSISYQYLPVLLAIYTATSFDLDKSRGHLINMQRSTVVITISHLLVKWGALAWWLGRQIPEREVGGFDPHSGHRVVSLSKTHLPPKRIDNTQEAMAPSQHD